MPSVLDDQKSISSLDSKNMLGAVEGFPQFMTTQLQLGMSARGRLGRSNLRNIVLMGMGGSASAGDLVLDWLGNKIAVPAFVHRDPSLPKFVGPDSLFIALSYSGDTRETIVAFREARKRRSSLMAIGTGGKLEELSREFDAPFLTVKPAPAPRAALAQMIVATATALHKSRITPDPTTEIKTVIQDLGNFSNKIGRLVPSTENPSKRLAISLRDRFPMIFAFRKMLSVARRFKNQLAENSKISAKHSLLPEASHNEIEAWSKQRTPLSPIFIRSYSESELEESMLEAFRSTIRRASGTAATEVRLRARTRLGELLLPVVYLDAVSVYLAFLRGIDPTDTPWIRRYKAAV